MFSTKRLTLSTLPNQSEILEKSLVSGEWDVKMFPDGRDGTARLPSTSASVVEHLQSLVKQKEGELTNTRSLVDSLERSRAAMAKDLATVSAEKESLSQEVQFISPLRERVQVCTCTCGGQCPYSARLVEWYRGPRRTVALVRSHGQGMSSSYVVMLHVISRDN